MTVLVQTHSAYGSRFVKQQPGQSALVFLSIEALRMGDDTVIQELQWLRDHPDASVRMAAADAIEFLD